jgi:hypothetical protein
VKRLAAALLMIVSTTAWAAEPRSLDPLSVHWAYSAYFGTGWYQVNNDRDAYILRYTPRWDLRTASLGEDGQRSPGVYLRFPVTAGLDVFLFDDLSGTLNVDNLATLTVTPGVDIEVPITDLWAIRPFATLGWGTVLDRSESAWIYWAGIKSRYTFHQASDLQWSLLNSLGYVGYSPNSGPSDYFWPLMIGLQFEYSPAKFKLGGDPTLLTLHLTYTSLERDLEFIVEGPTRDAISDQWELALALGKKDKPLKIWFMSFDRLGIGYRRSTNGDLRGITFVFRSVFDD